MKLIKHNRPNLRRKLWLFLRIVWRDGISAKTAWEVAVIVHDPEEFIFDDGSIFVITRNRA
jgi:hypothetical protein